MAQSVLGRPLPSASLPRNTFDRSFYTSVNWSLGMLLPVFCKFFPAGSHGKINRGVFMRTAMVNTAAFPILDTHVNFYKVPLKLLMTRYGEFKTNTQDLNSTGLTGAGGSTAVPNSMPFFEASDYANAVIGSGGALSYLDDFGYSIKYGADRLLDLLGYNDKNVSAGSSSQYNLHLNAFKLLAYQKVYYDHFRNTAYESNDPFAYNADSAIIDDNCQIQYDQLRKMLRIRYVNYRKDYFQNLYPGLNYVVSQPQGLDWNIPGSVLQMAWQTGSSTAYPNAESDGSVASKARIVGATNAYASLTVQNIRAAFALDKLMRASSYAPKHVKDQLAARYDVKPHYYRGDESEFLGSFMNPVTIGEVTCTAQASGSKLGQVGGKGVGGENIGTPITFDTYDDDCLILGMLYTTVRSNYDSNRVDKFNILFNREDLPVPEYMDLGLEPITRQEFNQVVTPSGSAANNAILGYVPRYQYCKTEVDENHGLFRSGGALGVYTNHTNTTQRGLTSGTNGVSSTYFKVCPADLDSIFMTNFDASSQGTDQFFGQFRFDVMVRSNLSVHGQPRL